MTVWPTTPNLILLSMWYLGPSSSHLTPQYKAETGWVGEDWCENVTDYTFICTAHPRLNWVCPVLSNLVNNIWTSKHHTLYHTVARPPSTPCWWLKYIFIWIPDHLNIISISSQFEEQFIWTTPLTVSLKHSVCQEPKTEARPYCIKFIRKARDIQW